MPRRVAVGLLAVVAASCGGGDDEAATTTSTTPLPPLSTVAPSPAGCEGRALRPLGGFGEVEVTVDGGDVLCMLAADDPASRAQGLMEQTDLRGYDGMVFEFDEPSTARFFMRDTLLPLSIAFFDDDGRFVSAADMDPCPDDVDDCPNFGADAPYVLAVEVAQGDLDRLGLVEGSEVTVTPPA